MTDPLPFNREELRGHQSSVAHWIPGYNGRGRGDIYAVPTIRCL